MLLPTTPDRPVTPENVAAALDYAGPDIYGNVLASVREAMASGRTWQQWVCAHVLAGTFPTDAEWFVACALAQRAADEIRAGLN